MSCVPTAKLVTTRHLKWFVRVAVIEQGPAFLMRCDVCGSLWQEMLHDAKLLNRSEAAGIYPEAKIG